MFNTLHIVVNFFFKCLRYTPMAEACPPTSFWQALKSIADWLDTSNWDTTSHPFFLENQTSKDELLSLRRANFQKVGKLKVRCFCVTIFVFFSRELMTI